MESNKNGSGDNNKCAISTLDHTNNSGKATSVPRECASQPSEWREKPYLCCICRDPFHTKTDIADHMIKHLTCPNKHKICPICNKSCVNTQALSRHLAVNHANITYFERLPVFRCDTCPFIGSSNSIWQEHRMKHQTTNRLQCSYCEKQFLRKSALLYHERNHNDERPFPCGKCGRSFSNPYYVSQHRKACGDDVMEKHIGKSHMLTPTKEERHVCNICGKAFRISRHRNWHMTMHHDMELVDRSAPAGNKNPKDKYHCMVCEKTFPLKVQLETHMKKQHKNEISKDKDLETNLCFKCGKVYKRKIAFEAHMKNRHEIRIALPHKCVFCKERFSCKLELLEHLKVHENKDGEIQFHIPDVEINKAHANTTDKSENTTYLCQKCGKVYKGKTAFEAHMKNWHDIRIALPHKCVFCKESKLELCEHLKVHENEDGQIPFHIHVPDVEMNKAHANSTDESENTTEEFYVTMLESPDLTNTAQQADNTKLPFTDKGLVTVITSKNTLNDIGRNSDNESWKDTPNSPIKQEPLYISGANTPLCKFPGPHVIAPLCEDFDNAAHEIVPVTALKSEDLDVTHETLHVIAPKDEHGTDYVIAPIGENSDNIKHETVHFIAPRGEDSDIIHVIAPLGKDLDVTPETLHVIAPTDMESYNITHETLHVIAPIGEESDNVKCETTHGIAPLGEEMNHVKNDTVDVIAPSSKESDKVDGINSPGAEEQRINYCASSRTHKIILINPNGGQKFIINTRIPQDMKKIVLKAQYRGITLALNVPLLAADTTLVTLPLIRQSTGTVDTVMPSPSTGQIERSSKRNIICNTTATTGNPENIQHNETSSDVAPHCPSSFILKTENLSSPAVGDTSQETGDITLTKRHKTMI